MFDVVGSIPKHGNIPQVMLCLLVLLPLPKELHDWADYQAKKFVWRDEKKWVNVGMTVNTIM